MANQKIAPGTWGSISTSQLPSGTWQAKTRYRRQDGTYNVAKASGRSANAARRNLEYRVSVLLRDRHRIGAHVTPDSTFAMLCEKWIEDANLIAAGQASTRHENIRIVRSNLIPALGEIRLREMSVSTVYAAYQAWYISTPSMARNIKGVLRKVCAFGVRLDALLFNPADQIGNFKRPDATIYAPTGVGTGRTAGSRCRLRASAERSRPEDEAAASRRDQHDPRDVGPNQ